MTFRRQRKEERKLGNTKSFYHLSLRKAGAGQRGRRAVAVCYQALMGVCFAVCWLLHFTCDNLELLSNFQLQVSRYC